jgi:hypothetical protein
MFAVTFCETKSTHRNLNDFRKPSTIYHSLPLSTSQVPGTTMKLLIAMAYCYVTGRTASGMTTLMRSFLFRRVGQLFRPLVSVSVCPSQSNGHMKLAATPTHFASRKETYMPFETLCFSTELHENPSGMKSNTGHLQ